MFVREDWFFRRGKRGLRRRIGPRSRRPDRLGLALLWLIGCLGRAATEDGAVPTYYHDMAPIFFRACATCHRPEQASPFVITNYPAAREHAEKIGRLTSKRKMPPWPLDLTCGEFEGPRILTGAEIELIQRWVAAGAPAGDPRDSPPLPEWPDGWQAGKPDLVVKMPLAFTLAAGTRDLYRNFTIPVSLDRPRYVRALQLRPVNNRVVHHAFVYVDRTGYSRQQEGRDGATGYSADMELHEGIGMPGGQFLTWQPGKLGPSGSEEMSWLLSTNSDLVLALHLNNGSAVPEVLQAEVGLYFTDTPPKVTVFKLPLFNFTIDLPAGASNQVIEDRFTLPVDVEARAVMPHLHYLGRTVEGWATLPDGTRQWLLRIPHWDFNWQGEYRYARPVPLPRGTVITMHYEFDNSTNNPVNPSRPPVRVRYGPKSTDEMAELWLQLIVPNPAGLPRLEQANNRHQAELQEALFRKRIADDPGDARAQGKLGLLLMSRSSGLEEAGEHLQAAVRIAPESDGAHYGWGLWLRLHRRLDEARAEFESATRLNPNHYKAHGNLGLLALEAGDKAAARHHFREALRLNPQDTLARQNLQQLDRETTPAR